MGLFDLQILLLATNPKGTHRIDLEEERRQIVEHARSLGASITICTLWATRPEDIINHVQTKTPDVLHIGGHGDTSGGLLFHNEAGQPTVIAPDAFASLVNSLKKKPTLIVVSCCHSAALAKALTNSVPWAIGMDGKISDDAAVWFSSGLYAGIVRGRSAKEAMEDALVVIRMMNLSGVDVPKLFLANGIVGEDLRVGSRAWRVGCKIHRHRRALLFFALVAWVLFGRMYVPRVKIMDNWVEHKQAETCLQVGAWSTNVVVVSLDDRTYESLLPVTDEKEAKGCDYRARVMHGEFMKQLARAEPRILLWTIVFDRNIPGADDKLVDGVKTLQEADCAVIFNGVELDTDGTFRLSDAVRTQGDGFGCIWLAPKSYTLAFLGTNEKWYPSLALEAYGKWRYPRSVARMKLLWRATGLAVTYWDRESGAFRGEELMQLLYEPTPTASTRTCVWESKLAVGTRIMLPSNEVLLAHTIAYESLMDMDVAKLNELIRGKIVIVGNLERKRKPGPDRVRVDDSEGGRDEFATYVVAVGLSNLLLGLDVGYGYRASAQFRLFGVIVGVIFGWWVIGRRKYSGSMVLAGVLATIATCSAYFVLCVIALYMGPLQGEVWYPSEGTIGFAVACAVGGLLGRWCNPGVREVDI